MNIPLFIFLFKIIKDFFYKFKSQKEKKKWSSKGNNESKESVWCNTFNQVRV